MSVCVFVCRVVAFSFFLRLSVFLWELPDIIIYTHRHRCCRVFVTLLWSAGQISVNRLMLRHGTVSAWRPWPWCDSPAGWFLQRAAKLRKCCVCHGISGRPSVYPSVTLRYCVKTRERRGMRSSPSGNPVSLVFWCQEWLMGTTLTSHCPGKIWVQRGRVVLYTFRLITPEQ